MTQSTRRIIQITVRFQNAVDTAHEKAAEAYDYNCQFDGGEFSGPASERALQREQDRIAQRFGIACADLAYGIADQVGAITRQPASLHGEPMPLPR